MEHQPSQESLDADVMQKLFSVLYSPTLSRFIESSRNNVLPSEPVVEAPSTSHYQTRSRAPFSPVRTPVMHQGHVYHVVNPQGEALFTGQTVGSDNAPVIRIVDGPAAGGGDAAELDASIDDVNYVHFLRTTLQADAGDLLVRPSDKEPDPNFYLRKRDEEDSRDQYDKTVPVKELNELIQDLEEHPVPGLAPLSEVTKEPPIVTRSAARCRSLEAAGFTPSPSASPMKSPAVGLNLRPRSTVRPSPVTSPTEVAPDANIAARTRAQVGKSPLKSTVTSLATVTDNFKRPLPVGDARGKRLKIGPSTSAQSNYEHHDHVESEPRSSREPVSMLSGMTQDMKERFKAVGDKLTKFLANPNFSEAEKAFVQQMIVKAIEGYAVPDAVVLAEYVFRVVELVSGDRSVTQVEPFFDTAKQTDFAFVCLVFGVLVEDDSPLILDLVPILYGKTRLLKAIQARMQVEASDPDQENFMGTFQTAFRANDRPCGLPKPDIGAAVALRLGVTGNEGLINPSVLKFMEEETIYNSEELLAEAATADGALTRSPSEESTPGTLNAAQKTPVPPKRKGSVARNLGLEFAHILEAQSDGSNSSMHACSFTPGAEGPGTIGSSGPVFPVATSSSQPGPSRDAGFEFDCTPAPRREPRRVPLISTALTFSPLKDPKFADPVLEDRRKSLRSSLRKPS